MNHKKWLALLVLVSLLIMVLKQGAAQIQSRTNYLLKKKIVDRGGALTRTINYRLADASGKGAVSQIDVWRIGLNWSKNHGWLAAATNGSDSTNLRKTSSATLGIHLTGNINPGGTGWIEFVVENVTDLFGIAFEMMYSPKTYVGLLENEAGSWLGDDIVSYSVIDTSLAKVSFGLSRKAGQGGISGSGTVAKLKVTLRNIDPVETELTLQNVVAIDPAGNPIQFDVANRTITAAADLAVICSLTGFELHQNYPNPFNPVTTIEFWLPQAGQVDLIILDTNGKEVQQLFHQIKPAGYHSVSWDGRNNVRQNVSSGVYFYRLEVKGQESIFWDVKKMILIR